MKCHIQGKYLWCYNLAVLLVALLGVTDTILADRVVSDAAPKVATSQDVRDAVDTPVTQTTPEVATTFVASAQNNVTTKTAAPVDQTINFSAVRVSDPSVDAGSGVKIYRNMLYGHSHLAFNVLKTMAVGTVFTATIDGVEAKYRVVSRTVYSRDNLNNDAKLRNSIYNYRGGVSLMTCGDGSNNDRDFRLVLLAERI